MKTVQITKWSELTHVAYENRDENWIYRGVTRSSHNLVPTIGRLGTRFKRGGKELEYDRDQEILLLEAFKRRARPMVTYQGLTQLEWLAIAQHHGLRTRLLDWSESLFVAAMFATERGVETTFDVRTREATGTNPPAIYAVRNLPEANQNEDPFSIDAVSLYRPAHISERIAPQQALFTIHPTPCEEFTSDAITKYVLEVEGTVDIKLALDKAGISRATLFPGLDGLAESLNWRHKWDALIG